MNSTRYMYSENPYTPSNENQILPDKRDELEKRNRTFHEITIRSIPDVGLQLSCPLASGHNLFPRVNPRPTAPI